MSAEEGKLTTASLAASGQADDEPAPAEADDGGGAAAGEDLQPLLSGPDADRFRERWEGFQRGFVDEPRDSVEQADALVAELMQKLAQTFSDERSSLEDQWSRGDDVSTEDLRVALQRYRSFFERLLAA